MICISCNTEIPDDSKKCPECGISFTDDLEELPDKEEKKEYTHYRIILLKQGPRSKVISILNELTGLNEKTIKKNIESLPWTFKERIPLSEAQEMRMLLEMNKAEVRIEGIDIWQEDDISLTDSTPGNADKKSHKFRNIAAAAVTLALLISIIGYLIDKSGKGAGILQNMGAGETQFSLKSRMDSEAGGELETEAQSEGDIHSTTRISKIDDQYIEFSFNGCNPYINTISFNLKVKLSCEIDLKIYDIELRPVTTLIHRMIEPDNYHIRWLGNTDYGEALPGVYIIEIISPQGTSFLKAVWLYK